MSRTRSLKVTAICGYTEPVGKPIVLYEYQPGRGAEHPEAFLNGLRDISIRTAMDSELSPEDTIYTLLSWNAPAECRVK